MSDPYQHVFRNFFSASGQNLTLGAPFDGGDDFFWVCGPSEGFGILFVSSMKRLIAAWRSTTRMEDAAFQPLFGQLGEVAPRRR